MGKKKKSEKSRAIPINDVVGEDRSNAENGDITSDNKRYEKELKEYQNLLNSLIIKSEDNYDKAVLTLSGGALGISFAFINGIIGSKPIMCPSLLFLSWIAWSFSVVCILYSFLSCEKSFSSIIEKLDEGKECETGKIIWTKLTKLLNILSGFLFVIGVTMFAFFVYKNVR